MSFTVSQSANRIIAASVGLMLLVSTVVGVLGWRLLAQEEASVQQQARDRLERTADRMTMSLQGRLGEIESWLGGSGELAAGDTPIAGGAAVVWFSDTSVDVASAGGLLYYPTTEIRTAIEPSVFARIDRLALDPATLSTASSALVTLTKSQDPVIQAEAMLRLARVQGELGRTAEALSTYDRLSRVTDAGDPPVGRVQANRGFVELLTPAYFVPMAVDTEAEVAFRGQASYSITRRAPLANAAGIPYRLVSQFARAQLLASAGREDEAREEARRLVSEISTGRWRLDEAAFTFYDSSARALARLDPPPPGRLAIARQVVALSNEWRAFQRSGARILTRRMQSADGALVIAVLHANRERLVALIGDANAMPTFGLDLEAAGENARASITDEHGRWLLGSVEPSGLEVARSLSAAGLPWRLRLTSSNGEATALLRVRRNYSIMAFSVFVLLVSGACYAIARGAMREAVTRRLQGDFVSAVSHEFRTPLTALRQLTEMLAHGRVPDEPRRRLYFDVLLKETSRLHLLVENLLDFGRMDAGRQQYRLEPIDLSALVRDGIEEYRTEGTANGHDVMLTADSSPLLVNADRDALWLVVRNLIENAVKYSPGAPTVWVQTGLEGTGAVIRVRDEGMGIPADEQSRIFDKFVRGEAAKRACIQGTGIGLSMVKEIVRLHRGEVHLASEVGHGSTFVVRLPLSDAAEERAS